MNLIFGHKDLPQKKYTTLCKLMGDNNFDVNKAAIFEGFISIKSISSQSVDKSKESAQFYLDLAYSNYISNNREGFINCVHNSDLAIKRRYDELISDILDIDHLFKDNKTLKNIKKFEFLRDELGIFIPNLIKEYVVDPRNSLEHQFKSSSEEQSLKAYEIARLFIDYTAKYLCEGLFNTIEFGYHESDFDIDISEGLRISFGDNTSKHTKKRFLFTYKNKTGDNGDYFILDSNHVEYLNLIKNMAFSKVLNSEHIREILKRI